MRARPLPQQSDIQPTVVVFCAALAVLACYASSVFALGAQSADLFALWLAGDFMAMGRMDQIYPVATPLFEMKAPSDWWAYAVETNPDARVFPYLYPPIWAKLISVLTPHMVFATFDWAVFALHQALLAGSVFLAARMCGLHGARGLVATCLTYAALVLSTPILLALSENQPQILVSFLIIAAFERAHFNHNRTAGAVLALAAAIKLYPLLFVVIFVARKNWTAATSFVIFGAMLGGASVALTGWPLHAEYLHLIQTVTRSVIVTNSAMSIDSFLGGLVFTDSLVRVPAPGLEDASRGWLAIAKTPLWAGVSLGATLCALALAARSAARHPNDPLILPALATVLALLSPLSWAYTYVTAFVFLLALPSRLGRAGSVLCGVMVVYFNMLTPKLWLGQAATGLTGAWIGAGVLLVLMAISFTYAVVRPPTSRPVD